MDWRIEGMAQKALCALPAGLVINDVLQLHLGSVRDLNSHLAMKVMDGWAVLANYMKGLGVGLAGLRYVEIGTGWFPILPICFVLAGAQKVVTFDLTRHLNARPTPVWLPCSIPFCLELLKLRIDRSLKFMRAMQN
jgi:hypothetical protein